MAKKKPSRYSSWMKYSGMGIQLIVLLFIGVFVGEKLDTYLQLDQPWMTIIMIFFLFFAWFYRLYLDLTQP